jgi:hypothetical protein
MARGPIRPAPALRWVASDHRVFNDLVRYVTGTGDQLVLAGDFLQNARPEPIDIGLHHDFLQKAEAAIDVAFDRFEKAKQSGDAKETLKTQVVLASWLLMGAELASDSRLEQKRLVRTANDYFDVGQRHRDEIEVALKDKQGLEDEITADEEVSLHLDALRFRSEAINRHLGESRQKEKALFDTLQTLARDYRAATESYALTTTYLLTRDYESARKAHGEAAQLVKRIGEEGKTLRDPGKGNLYVLHEEMRDFGNPETPEYRLFSPDFATHHDSLAALMACRESAGKAGEPDVKELSRAIDEANGLLKVQKDNLIALYTVALASETKGVALRRQDPYGEAAWTNAAPLFEAARKAYEQVGRLAGERAAGKEPASPEGLPRQAGQLADMAGAKERAAYLAGPELYLERAGRLVLGHQFADAVRVLREGIERHRDARLVATYATVRLRAGEQAAAVRADLTRAREAKLFSPKEEALLHLALGRAALAELGSSPTALADAERHLRDGLASIGPADVVTANAIRGHLAYVLSLTAQGATPAERQHRLDDAQVQADQVEAFAESDAGKKLLRSDPPAGLDEVVFREAVVDYRLALAQLGASRSPEYYGRALDWLAKAQTTAASLSFGSQKRPFAESFLQAARSHPAGTDSGQLRVEEARRVALSRVVSGLGALQLGRTSEGTREIEAALEWLRNPDPQRPLAATPGEVLLESNLTSDLLALLLLRELDGLSAAALNKRDLVLKARKALTADLLERQKAGQPDSPLAAYARGRAAEELLVATTPAPAAEHDRVKQEALAELRRSRELLESPSQRQRYPALSGQTDEALDRLERPAHYHNVATDLRTSLRLREADRALVNGLARHPHDQGLWEMRAAIRIDELLMNPSPDRQRVAEVLNWLGEIPPGFARSYTEATVHELLNDWPKAADAYGRAEQEAETARDDQGRIRARAKYAAAALRGENQNP